jgi:hypothetical protein
MATPRESFGGVIPKQGVDSKNKSSNTTAAATSNLMQPTISSNNKSKQKDASNVISKSKQLNEVAADVVGTKLMVRHAYGYGWQQNDEIISYQSTSREKETLSDRIIYRVGKQVCVVDPDGNTPQRFLTNISKHVNKILHISVSKNNRYLSVCEALDAQTHAQVSVYSVDRMSKSKTITKQSTGNFIQSSFLAESKYLVTLLEADGDYTIIIWHWEKEKTYKTIALPSKVTIKNHNFFF